jgi:Uma2 family endonuclease
VVAVSPNPTAVIFPTSWEALPIRVRTATPFGEGELFELCQANRDLRIERASDGELIIMPPTGGETGRRNATLTRRLGDWAERDGSGIAFDSSTGFLLPNGAMRAPTPRGFAASGGWR